MRRRLGWLTLVLLLPGIAWGHDLAADNARYIGSLSGAAIGPWLYLGAKHMFTGYDHLLFLLAVIFYLYRPRDILLYVTLFTLGHSLTLTLGVALQWQVNSHLIDAVIGLSVVYKALENMGGIRRLFGAAPDPRLAVVVFGLFHGLGLATRMQAYSTSADGLWINMLSFNLGVELGQVLALALILVVLLNWRNQSAFGAQAYSANTVIMTAGLVLTGNELAGYLLT